MLAGERVMPDTFKLEREMVAGRRPRPFSWLLCWHDHSRTGTKGVQAALLRRLHWLSHAASLPQGQIAQFIT
jgi:hypothetical protein